MTAHLDDAPRGPALVRPARNLRTRCSNGANAMTRPPDDDTLFRTVRDHLFTAVIGDVMDAAGLMHQFLPPAIRALHPDMVAVGRAMPVLEADCGGEHVSRTG